MPGPLHAGLFEGHDADGGVRVVPLPPLEAGIICAARKVAIDVAALPKLLADCRAAWVSSRMAWLSVETAAETSTEAQGPHSRSSSHGARVRFSSSPVVRATRRGPTAGACCVLAGCTVTESRSAPKVRRRRSTRRRTRRSCALPLLCFALLPESGYPHRMSGDQSKASVHHPHLGPRTLCSDLQNRTLNRNARPPWTPFKCKFQCVQRTPERHL